MARFHWPFQTQTRSPTRDFCNAGADLIDDAGAVAVRDHPRVSNFSGRSQARFDIGRVDAGGREFDAHFAGAGMRRFDFADAQDVARGSVTFVIDGLHGSPPEPDDSTPAPSANWDRTAKSRKRCLSALF